MKGRLVTLIDDQRQGIFEVMDILPDGKYLLALSTTGHCIVVAPEGIEKILPDIEINQPPLIEKILHYLKFAEALLPEIIEKVEAIAHSTMQEQDEN